ncbi:Snurportin-1 [Fasciolopsis buskii]|uniref:Snurportin-1 n=1 Tax=Fasciolopsis buskii TaxID=27845 RepID=A0A8E0VJG8_9TREM|nr:Snurportin-1 [Fasciolopsis buski]
MQEQREVDQLVQEMDLSLSVDLGEAAVVSEQANHPRLSLYKNRGRALDQERRWWQSLRMHRSKVNRSMKFDSNRCFLSASSEKSSDKNGSQSSCKSSSTTMSVGYIGASWRSYSKHLMLAEWLLFFPPSFFESYAFKLCPKGRQVFVKAQKVSRFRSCHLPSYALQVVIRIRICWMLILLDLFSCNQLDIHCVTDKTNLFG